MENNNSLVSIVIITYNSSKYVLETLESAKEQTYQNIELIISDDCSTDNTVEICKKWIEEYKNRFVRTELITVETNTGISPNCNRGCKAAKGEWIKSIAGDDILLESCIEDNINETFNIGSNIFILFSSMIIFNNNEEIKTSHKPLFFDLKDNKSKKNYLNIKYFGLTPSIFIRKSIFYIVGYFDENYPFMEDYPFIYKVVHNGCGIEYFDKVTVKYRIGDGIFTNKQYVVNEKFFDSDYRFYKNVRSLKIKNILVRICINMSFFKQRIALKYLNNKYNVIYKIFNKIINLLISLIWKTYKLMTIIEDINIFFGKKTRNIIDSVCQKTLK